MTDYFTEEWAKRFAEGLERDWRLAGLRHPVPIVLEVTDDRETLTVTASREALTVVHSPSEPDGGLVLAAAPEVWEALFADEQESLTRLTRQGRVRLDGDRGSTLLRWRIVFAILEAMALTARGEL